MTTYTKKTQARIIFNEVRADGYDLQGRSTRCEFIRRAQLEIKDQETGLLCCSRGWANNYWDNRMNWINHIQMKTGKKVR